MEDTMAFREGPVDLEALQRAQKAAPAAPNLVIPRPTQAGAVLMVTRERLEAPSQRVTVLNTSPNQNHIVMDRHMRGHELRPGERKEVEMLVDEIEAFRKLGAPHRGMYTPMGKQYPIPLPQHPLRFIDLPAPPSARQDDGGGGDNLPSVGNP
jgi:hypothetical protein